MAFAAIWLQASSGSASNKVTAARTLIWTRDAVRGILFVGHEATRTGAPTELLHFVRWFKKNGNRPFSILLGRGGELTTAFQEVADTWSLERSNWRPESLRSRFFRRLGLGQWTRRAEAADVAEVRCALRPGLGVCELDRKRSRDGNPGA